MIFRKSLSFVLIIFILFTTMGMGLFYPKKTQAWGGGTAAAIAIQTGLQTIWQGITAVWQTVMATLTAAQTAITQWMQLKEICDTVAAVEKILFIEELMGELTNDLVAWIQNGGEPRFDAFGDYLLRAANLASDKFINSFLGAGYLCEPFDLDIKIALSRPPTPEHFGQQTSCTISDVVNNINDFYNDFSQGGWAGWIELTKPENNALGVYLTAAGEKALREEKAIEEVKKEMAEGDGFLSMKDCYWTDQEGTRVKFPHPDTGKITDTWNNVIGACPAPPEVCDQSGPLDSFGIYYPTAGGYWGPCIEHYEILSPATLVQETIERDVIQPFEEMTAHFANLAQNAGCESKFVTAVMNSLLNRVWTEGVGILKAGTTKDSQGKIGYTGTSYGYGSATSTQDIANSCPNVTGKKCSNDDDCPTGTQCYECCTNGIDLEANCKRCFSQFQINHNDMGLCRPTGVNCNASFTDDMTAGEHSDYTGYETPANSCPEIDWGKPCNKDYHCADNESCDGCCPDGVTKPDSIGCARCNAKETAPNACRGSQYCNTPAPPSTILDWEEECAAIPAQPCFDGESKPGCICSPCAAVSNDCWLCNADVIAECQTDTAGQDCPPETPVIDQCSTIGGIPCACDSHCKVAGVQYSCDTCCPNDNCCQKVQGCARCGIPVDIVGYGPSGRYDQNCRGNSTCTYCANNGRPQCTYPVPIQAPTPVPVTCTNCD